MSRIGRKHIDLPAGVTLTQENGVVVVKGPKGELRQDVDKCITVSVNGTTVELTRANELNETKAKKRKHIFLRLSLLNFSFYISRNPIIAIPMTTNNIII